MRRYWTKMAGYKAGRTQGKAGCSSRFRVRLRVEALEDRQVLSWAGVPPESITPPGSAVQITLDNQGDATGGAAIENGEDDYYALVAHSTGTYQFDARAANSTIDTVLGVFDASGQLLASNDDITPGTDRNSRVSVTLQAGARYYFGITNYTGEPDGAYTWSVDGPVRDRRLLSAVHRTSPLPTRSVSPSPSRSPAARLAAAGTSAVNACW